MPNDDSSAIALYPGSIIITLSVPWLRYGNQLICLPCHDMMLVYLLFIQGACYPSQCHGFQIMIVHLVYIQGVSLSVSWLPNDDLYPGSTLYCY